MATTAIHVQGGPVVMPQQQQRTQKLSTIKGLAITQLVIGVLTVIFGIAVTASLYTKTWTTNTTAGIWAGGWISITGIIGVCSIRSTASGQLNGVYMAFCIISTCASALAGLFFVIAVVIAIDDLCFTEQELEQILNRFYRDDCDYVRDVGLGLHVPLLVMMIVEFFVSIIAAVYSCQRGCCIGQSQTGVIIQQSHPQVSVLTTSADQQPTVYQYQRLPQYDGQAAPQYAVQVPQQYSGQVGATSQGPPAYGQPMYTQGQYPMQANVAYSEKPPDYNAAPH